MRIVIVNTSERKGGAATAAHRLYKALAKEGHDVFMLVRDKQSNDPQVFSINEKPATRCMNRIPLGAASYLHYQPFQPKKALPGINRAWHRPVGTSAAPLRRYHPPALGQPVFPFSQCHPEVGPTRERGLDFARPMACNSRLPLSRRVSKI